MKPLTTRGRCTYCRRRLSLEDFAYSFTHSILFNEFGDRYILGGDQILCCTEECYRSLTGTTWKIATPITCGILDILDEWLNLHEDFGQETQLPLEFIAEEYPQMTEYFDLLFARATDVMLEEPRVEEVRPENPDEEVLEFFEDDARPNPNLAIEIREDVRPMQDLERWDRIVKASYRLLGTPQQRAR